MKIPPKPRVRAPLPAGLMGLAGVWAFVESGLGGVMHALKLPFTGIWVGGTAVAVLIVMAGVLRGRYSHKAASDASISWTLLQATVLVMAVKLMASPHSPPTAYVAVGFQGVLAAGLLSWFKPFRLGAVVFAVLAMLESALQKLLMMTLVYGAAWVDALEAMTALAAKQLKLEANGLLLLWGYIGLYAVWGLALGFWASGWAGKPSDLLAQLQAEWKVSGSGASPSGAGIRKRRPWRRGLALGLMLMAVLGGLALSGAKSDTLIWVAGRSLMATALMLLAAGPLRVWIGKRLAGRGKARDAQEVMGGLASQQTKFHFCWSFAAAHHPRWQQPLRAIEYFIHLDLDFD